jgi:hypothetical protein
MRDRAQQAGRIRNPSPATTPTARSIRPAPAVRRFGPQADDVDKMKMELLRVRFDEQARGREAQVGQHAIESGVTGSSSPGAKW